MNQLMQIVSYTDGDVQQILKRPSADVEAYFDKVRPVMQAVKEEGDAAIERYTLIFDKVEVRELKVTAEEFDAAEKLVSSELKTAIQQAATNIERFHSEQKEQELIIDTMPGVHCRRKSIGIEKVGLYIPGGTAPLFSTVLMLGIPARIAGCKQVILCTPPAKDGSIHPAILFAAKVAGITEVYKVGGAQAIAAMAYGTASVPKVFKIFGPGNPYVTAAKQLAALQGVAIDLPAGPSEVLVLADNSCVPAFVAADLLSQAEHGMDSQVVLVSNSRQVIDSVLDEVTKQLDKLPRKDIAAEALKHSVSVLVSDMEQAMKVVNEYAPEHLILAVNDADALANKVVNAGSVFIGNYTPEAAGDYASGTNHTLPTNGYAVAYSGVSLDSFVKKVTFQHITAKGIKALGTTIELMAEAEQLDAHKNAVTVRLEYLKKQENNGK